MNIALSLKLNTYRPICVNDMLQIAVSAGCVRLDFTAVPSNQSAINFYTKFEAEDMTDKAERHYFEIPEEPLRKLATYSTVI